MKKSLREMISEKSFQEKILLDLANGYSYKEISQKMKLTKYEMRYCTKFLFKKYNAINKVSLVYHAICSKDIDISKIKKWVK